MCARESAGQKIRDAYIGLLEEMPFDRIRAVDVIRRAGVGRSTFYDHFDSVSAVLESIEDDLFRSYPASRVLARDIQASAEEVQEEGARLLRDHLRTYARIYRVLMGPNGDYAFQTRMTRYCERVIAHLMSEIPSLRTDEEKEVIAQALVGMQWHAIRCWARGGNTSVEVLATTLLQLHGAIIGIV